LYPAIDEARCIHCNNCKTVCPSFVQGKLRKQIFVYAAKNLDEKTRMASSSGGIFSLLAEQIIDEDGVVFGVCFNDKWEVMHDCTEA
jgi:Fe-S-cluster-containing dehydrogenase component